jgi:hypothetical protein
MNEADVAAAEDVTVLKRAEAACRKAFYRKWGRPARRKPGSMTRQAALTFLRGCVPCRTSCGLGWPTTECPNSVRCTPYSVPATGLRPLQTCPSCTTARSLVAGSATNRWILPRRFPQWGENRLGQVEAVRPGSFRPQRRQSGWVLSGQRWLWCVGGCGGRWWRGCLRFRSGGGRCGRGPIGWLRRVRQ